MTTDFGLSDHYVGTMKGVILSRCPQAAIVDITHGLPPFSIPAGAYAITQAAPYFPAGTVHVIVIDPGVGTQRKPILAEANDQLFIAPDNGVLAMVLARDSKSIVREIVNRDLWLPIPSATFHGRDIFAPVAASLAAGLAKPEDVGPKLDKAQQLADMHPNSSEATVWSGLVLSIDHFGNVVTNLPSTKLPHTLFEKFTLTLNQHKIDSFHKTFGEAPPGVPFVYFGSSGYVEIGINQQNAAETLGVAPGQPLTLSLKHP